MMPSTQSARPPPSRRRRSSSTLTQPPPHSQTGVQPVEHTYPSRRPPAFWDNLSRLHLCKSALKEQDRRARLDQPLGAQIPSIEPRTRRQYREYNPTLSPEERRRLERAIKKERFAEIGGPDLSDLRGYYPTTPMSSLKSFRGKKEPLTLDTAKSSPYDQSFRVNLKDHHIYAHETGNLPLPSNFDNIEQALTRRRPSLSEENYTEDQLKNFREELGRCSTESDYEQRIVPLLEGGTGGEYRTKKQWTMMKHLTNGLLTACNPDRYHGANPESLDPEIRQDLKNLIIPAPGSLIAPNFVLEVKTRGGNSDVAVNQACYAGALSARGIFALQNHGKEEQEYDGNAYTLTSTLVGNYITIYSTHMLKPYGTRERPEYDMVHILDYQLSNARTTRMGINLYRNARDWAKRMRDRFITEANQRLARKRARESGLEGGTELAEQQTVTEQMEEATEALVQQMLGGATQETGDNDRRDDADCDDNNAEAEDAQSVRSSSKRPRSHVSSTRLSDVAESSSQQKRRSRESQEDPEPDERPEKRARRSSGRRVRFSNAATLPQTQEEESSQDIPTREDPARDESESGVDSQGEQQETEQAAAEEQPETGNQPRETPRRAPKVGNPGSTGTTQASEL